MAAKPKLVVAKQAPPSSEEVVRTLKKGLKTAGLDPEAFDIIAEPYNLIAPGLLSSATDQYFPCYVVIAKSNGMAFLFPTLGPHGVYQRAHNETERLKVN